MAQWRCRRTATSWSVARRCRAARTLIDNAVNSADHTTLVAAVKAADLVGTLKGKGPFTVFAPTNEAFAALPAGTVDNLLKPENKADAEQGADVSRGRGQVRLRRASGCHQEGPRHRGAPDGSGGKLWAA